MKKASKTRYNTRFSLMYSGRPIETEEAAYLSQCFWPSGIVWHCLALSGIVLESLDNGTPRIDVDVICNAVYRCWQRWGR